MYCAKLKPGSNGLLKTTSDQSATPSTPVPYPASNNNCSASSKVSFTGNFITSSSINGELITLDFVFPLESHNTSIVVLLTPANTDLTPVNSLVAVDS